MIALRRRARGYRKRSQLAFTRDALLGALMLQCRAVKRSDSSLGGMTALIYIRWKLSMQVYQDLYPPYQRPSAEQGATPSWRCRNARRRLVRS